MFSSPSVREEFNPACIFCKGPPGHETKANIHRSQLKGGSELECRRSEGLLVKSN